MKKEMNKRGLSDVVTTVLIILFAIVAVAVVGGIVMNQINKAGKNIDKASFCTENIVEPVTCVNSSQATGGVIVPRVGYTRTACDAGLTNVRFNIEETDGNVESFLPATAITIGKGSSGTYYDASNFKLVANRLPKSVELVAEYTYKGAEKVTCTSKKLDCTL